MPTSKSTSTKASVDKRVNGAADVFYRDVLVRLVKTDIPFMIGGTFAVNAYTAMNRPTKDLDIFVKASDYPKIIHTFAEQGFKTTLDDERWLAKAYKGKLFFDIIFNARNALMPITDDWLKKSHPGTVYGVEVKFVPPTELVWSKMFIQGREKYEGNDVAHLLLKKGEEIDWKQLLSYSDQYWEVLLCQLLNFRFIYPSEREMVPRWLLEELVARLASQVNLPTSKMRVCRGRLFSAVDFLVDVQEWGFVDIIGTHGEKNPPEKGGSKK